MNSGSSNGFTLPKGFVRDFGGRDKPCVGIFGAASTGKTRLCVTASEYAAVRGTVPGWLVCDRNTRHTVRATCSELGLDTPLIQKEDFISHQEALEVATLDREKDHAKIAEIFTKVIRRFLGAAVELGKVDQVDPIVVETGTQVWDWISYAHFGRKQNVGRSREWGPPKQDWTDLFDALSHKTVLITFWERDEYRDDKRTGFTKPDGPPHLSYTTTTLVRTKFDRDRKLLQDEDQSVRFSLDVVESHDNIALAGSNEALRADGISYSNLMMLLRPEE